MAFHSPAPFCSPPAAAVGCEGPGRAGRSGRHIPAMWAASGARRGGRACCTPPALLLTPPAARGVKRSPLLRDGCLCSVSCRLIPKKIRGTSCKLPVLSSPPARALILEPVSPLGSRPSSPQPAAQPGLVPSSELPFYEQKSCWHERTTKSHHLEPLSGAEGFQLSKKEGFCSAFDVSAVRGSLVFSPRFQAGRYDHLLPPRLYSSTPFK